MNSRRNTITAGALVLVAAIAAVAGYFYLKGPLSYVVEGPATVPDSGRLIVENHLVQLDGLVAPRRDADCRVGGQILQCSLISQARLIEMVAGKTVRCEVTRYPSDERNWGRCSVRNPDPALFTAGEDDINRNLVRLGWAIADQQHFPDYIADGQQARTQRIGLWQGTVGERRVGTNVLAGVPIVKDGDTIELMDIEIHLRGVDAPELFQTCKMDGIEYDCGQRARANLVDLLAGIPLVCHVGQFPGDDRVWGRCGEDDGTRRDFKADAVPLNAAVVTTGWGMARPDTEVTYIEAEAFAKKEKRGMWAGEFVRPADWRRGVR
jgi:endonuclease YncB( thermonuclease family)